MKASFLVARSLVAILLAGAVGVACSAVDPEVGARRTTEVMADAGPTVSFARDIRPLMNREPNDPTGHGCKTCHYTTGGTRQGIEQAGLDLTALGTLRKGGGSSGAKIVVAGDPDASIIVQKLEGTYPGARMPKDGPAYWSHDEIMLLRRWIQQGAKGADSE
ncbi:MAG: hypothetical protein NVS3B10_29370 [Polyangiales bacterium]